MINRPRLLYLLVLLWFVLSGIFVNWGWFSLSYFTVLPIWLEPVKPLIPQLYFGYMISTIVWFVFSSLFIIIAYGTFKKHKWVWTTSIIISTIFLVVFGLMLAAFMVNAVMFQDWFSIYGLISVVLSILIDLGIIFLLTRPIIKKFFDIN